SIPNMDFLSKNGELGLVKTVPDRFSPGSDVANLSVMGYNPEKYYTGRSPLEAISMGLDLGSNDIAIRCNLVTLSDNMVYNEKTLLDHSSDEISTEESHELINEISKHFNNDYISFHEGISYRHCMIWKNCDELFKLTPPHDIINKKINDFLPEDSGGKFLYNMMNKSYNILKNHPVNKKRMALGLKPANSIWLWGAGKKAELPKFNDKFNLKGSVISAVDLIKGIAICSGLESIDVKGATGTLNTNYKGKAVAALNALDSGKDFVYIHIEAPDECGHRGEISNKVKAIELIDSQIIKPLISGLNKYDDYKIMILPDHSTPLILRTHTKDPVPYIIYSKKELNSSNKMYDEYNAKNTFNYISNGYEILNYFLTNSKSKEGDLK
ncbi:MAG: cofactor-independent phosphoglycerate mutase, partial [Clostridiales bacterium]